MKTMLLAVLQTIIRSLVGAMNYERIQQLVLNAEHSPLSGVEKRALVVDEAKSIGLALGTALLNLAIEAAVNTLRNKT